MEVLTREGLRTCECMCMCECVYVRSYDCIFLCDHIHTQDITPGSPQLNTAGAEVTGLQMKDQIECQSSYLSLQKAAGRG